MKKIFYFTIAGLMLLLACRDNDMFGTIDGGPRNVIDDSTTLVSADYRPGDTTFGVVYAILQDSVFWVASGLALSQAWHTTDPEKYFDLQFNTYESEFGFHRENMYLSEISKSTIGNVKISGGHFDLDDGFVGASFHTLTDDGDVCEDSYEVDESVSNNMLIISSIDSINNIYRGSFTVTFKIATIGGKMNPDNPDKITFKDASFWVKIQE